MKPGVGQRLAEKSPKFFELSKHISLLTVYLHLKLYILFFYFIWGQVAKQCRYGIFEYKFTIFSTPWFESKLTTNLIGAALARPDLRINFFKNYTVRLQVFFSFIWKIRRNY